MTENFVQHMFILRPSENWYLCVSHGREAVVFQGCIVTFLSQHWTSFNRTVSELANWLPAGDLVTLNFKDKHTLNNFAEAALHEFQENLHGPGS